MTGSNSQIKVANGTGSGYSPVAFNGAAILIGGAGDTFNYHLANVTGSIIPISFTLHGV